MATAAKAPRNLKADDETVAQALTVLEVNHGNVRATAKQLGVRDSTLRRWMNRGEKSAAIASLRAEKKLAANRKFRNLADTLIAVAFQGAHKLDAYRATLAACAATDKALLLEGKPNRIVEHLSADPLNSLSQDALTLLYAMTAKDVTPIIDSVTVVDATVATVNGVEDSAV